MKSIYKFPEILRLFPIEKHVLHQGHALGDYQPQTSQSYIYPEDKISINILKKRKRKGSLSHVTGHFRFISRNRFQRYQDYTAGVVNRPNGAEFHEDNKRFMGLLEDTHRKDQSDNYPERELGNCI
jgi:hypothetical protein